ncbi:hypothetical protein [Shinella oryzae]|uniref:hypothetical protein n=1 Tax=Shinella oryzae TaxID=2871820 RepID=UPI001FF297A6|nr:hypothetical protein [Shinella oryzae]UPA25433.1 hypothetical protein K6301_04325 [Shinella oryzae]
MSDHDSATNRTTQTPGRFPIFRDARVTWSVKCPIKTALLSCEEALCAGFLPGL